MKNLYHELLLDHYAHPRNFGEVVDPSIVSQQYNPSCGDAVSVTGHIRDGMLADVKFKAVGCIISVAGASLLSELIIAQPLTFIEELDTDTIVSTIGIPLGPVRIKCALLPFYAVQDALLAYKKQQKR